MPSTKAEPKLYYILVKEGVIGPSGEDPGAVMRAAGGFAEGAR